jgi:hypothetical protein
VLGDRTNSATTPAHQLAPTTIDLRCLGDLVESIVAQVREHHMRGVALPWIVDDVSQLIARVFFHPATRSNCKATPTPRALSELVSPA